MSTRKKPIRSPEEVDRLVNENIRLAYYFARKWAWAHGDNEALSLALDGLLIAAQTWDGAGGPFGTWAGNRIKWRFSLENQRQRAVKRGGTGASGLRQAAVHIFLDAKVNFESDMTLADVIPDERAAAPGEEYRENERVAGNAAEVRRLLGLLSKRDAEIMRLRYGLHGRREHILEEIAKKYRLTRERIRQIEDKALRKFWREKRRKKLEPVVVTAQCVPPAAAVA